MMDGHQCTHNRPGAQAIAGFPKKAAFSGKLGKALREFAIMYKLKYDPDGGIVR
jgi:hypothetical protein